ncbi:hypothetical protein QO002_000903 [Pararhizobium capsulatum DSM 1112]|uniref:Uncharacterized protein n=1 Tax=Pararhizobium capsulatum DSM 1112 TaxID=1121113 RepID=A0ABU0BKI7_9HYPH|nr:hypothetical protein [Pararhizobium capsulatum]MDQ0318765.1 hypothetical protein [Pararhizobium capsulatum DSM 1112]
MGYRFREQDNYVRIVELTPAMRKQIENTIEHLLSVLDHFDGDENLEWDDAGENDGDEESSLTWFARETVARPTLAEAGRKTHPNFRQPGATHAEH